MASVIKLIANHRTDIPGRAALLPHGLALNWVLVID
jgi:hypothetical protein